MSLAATRVLACVAAGLVAAGCASMRRQRAHDRALERQLDAHRHTAPLEDVWQEARRLLAQGGYPLGEKDAEAVGQKPMGWLERMTSPARETATSDRGWSLDTGWNRYRERYHLEGRSDAGGCQVIFTRMKEDPTDRRVESSRDLGMQLTLARRVDPAGAARIEEEVRAATSGTR